MLTTLLFVLCLLLQFSKGALNADEQLVLVNWYNSLTSKGALNWNTGADLCEQTGVSCYGTSNVGLFNPYQKGLMGTFPSLIGNLTKLTWLNIWGNQLSGTIPTEIGNLFNIKLFNIWGNPLTGTIPTEIGRLTNITQFFLYQTQLTGTMPTELGNLIKVGQFWLQNNQLTGTIPTEVKNLKSIYGEFYLSGNYWDCPVFDYTTGYTTDYLTTKGQCDLSCNPNPCLNGGNCSTRLSGNFQCKCLSEYTGINCETDVNECSLGTHNCALQANCTNTPGSFNCTCKEGYSGDGVTCTDIDECSGSNNCAVGTSTCENTIGSYTCACNNGYSGNGFICYDIDECLDNNGGCDEDANCKNIPGSFNCTCKGGYSGDGVTCTDIDECSGSNNCAVGTSTCENTIGSYTCTCNPGYDGNGDICNDINECLTNNGGCHADANCKNLPGGFNCTCKTGYSGNGTSCDDINECLTNNGGCDEQANCENTIGSSVCACKEGYLGNGISCTQISEKDESNQAIGIGVGVSFGLLALILLVLLVLFFLRKNKKKKEKTEDFKHESLHKVNLEDISASQNPRKNSTIIVGDVTLMNTKFEFAIPGFMNIDFVNKIRKEEKIGGGGTAVTLKGVLLDPKLRNKFDFKDVAIKQIFDDNNFSPEENRLRFEQEIIIIWAVSSHPNILTLVGYSENPRCIITKLYDQDLYQYIKKTTENIPSEIIFKWAKNIASGMSFVHTTKIAHRDLKTSNILLEKVNGEMNAVICDFGIARINSEDNIMINHKAVNVKGFSPRYTAPEVFGRMMVVSSTIPIEDEMKSDVYSYSMILWEMMARKVPWSNLKETDDIDFQVRSGKREPIPDTHGNESLELLSSIIEFGWKQVPNERPTFQQIDQKLSPATQF